jgi:transcriptional regulator
MYIPELFKNENQEEITHFLKKKSFGILVNQTNQKLVATHIPLEYESNQKGQKVLYGHIAIENPQWNGFNESPEVLAIFSGAHSYISPSWYDHENVPTWNYIAVHVYGNLRIIQGEEMLYSLKKLVDKYEANSEKPVKMENFSKKTMMQTRGIVAFEIEITEIQAVKKLSQNRDEKNHKVIVEELEKTKNSNSIAIANEMRKNKI